MLRGSQHGHRVCGFKGTRNASMVRRYGMNTRLGAEAARGAGGGGGGGSELATATHNRQSNPLQRASKGCQKGGAVAKTVPVCQEGFLLARLSSWSAPRRRTGQFFFPCRHWSVRRDMICRPNRLCKDSFPLLGRSPPSAQDYEELFLQKQKATLPPEVSAKRHTAARRVAARPRLRSAGCAACPA